MGKSRGIPNLERSTEFPKSQGNPEPKRCFRILKRLPGTDLLCKREGKGLWPPHTGRQGPRTPVNPVPHPPSLNSYTRLGRTEQGSPLPPPPDAVQLRVASPSNAGGAQGWGPKACKQCPTPAGLPPSLHLPFQPLLMAGAPRMRLWVQISPIRLLPQSLSPRLSSDTVQLISILPQPGSPASTEQSRRGSPPARLQPRSALAADQPDSFASPALSHPPPVLPACLCFFLHPKGEREDVPPPWPPFSGPSSYSLFGHRDSLKLGFFPSVRTRNLPEAPVQGSVGHRMWGEFQSRGGLRAPLSL